MRHIPRGLQAPPGTRRHSLRAACPAGSDSTDMARTRNEVVPTMNPDGPLAGGKLADALGRLARAAEPDPAHDSATIARARVKFVAALPGRMPRRRTPSRAF